MLTYSLISSDAISVIGMDGQEHSYLSNDLYILPKNKLSHQPFALFHLAELLLARNSENCVQIFACEGFINSGVKGLISTPLADCPGWRFQMHSIGQNFTRTGAIDAICQVMQEYEEKKRIVTAELSWMPEEQHCDLAVMDTAIILAAIAQSSGYPVIISATTEQTEAIVHAVRSIRCET